MVKTFPYIIVMTHEAPFANSSGGSGTYYATGAWGRWKAMIDSAEANNVSLWVAGHYVQCQMVNHNGHYYIDNHGAGSYYAKWDSSWVTYADTSLGRVGARYGRPSFFEINVCRDSMTIFPKDTLNQAFGDTFIIYPRTFSLNLTARIDALGRLVLSWSPIPGAVQYYIYMSANNWNAGYVRIDSTSSTQYVDSTAVAVRRVSFYRVTADPDGGIAPLDFPRSPFNNKPNHKPPNIIWRSIR